MGGGGARLGWAAPVLAVLAVAVLLPLATFLVGVWLFGAQLQGVQSGSMAPTFPTGSLLVVAPVDPTAVDVGMPVTFVDPGAPDRLVTHRVLAVRTDGGLQFVTQGDANARPDALPVPARMIRGRVLWHVNGLGDVLTWLQWPRGFVLLVLIPAGLLVVAEVGARRRRRSGAVSTGAGAAAPATGEPAG